MHDSPLRPLSAVLLAVLLCAPPSAFAQQQQAPAPEPQPSSAPAPEPQSPQSSAPQSQPQQTPPAAPGLTVDPSAGPQTPHPEQPAASSAAPASNLPDAPQPAAQAPAPPQRPLGAAAAGEVRTAGGAASRPAGNAIAPVKQRQYRSLVIKLAAVAAAGIALGTVYGLSHATSSVPPHSASAVSK